MRSFASLWMRTVHTPSRRPTFRPPTFFRCPKWPALIALTALTLRTCPRSAGQILARDPEHLALVLLGVEPEEGQTRERRFERLAAAADLAEERAVRREVPGGLGHDAAHQIETVVARGQGQARLMTVLWRQTRHGARIDIGRVAEDEVVAPGAERLEEIAAMERDAIAQAMRLHIAPRQG